MNETTLQILPMTPVALACQQVASCKMGLRMPCVILLLSVILILA